MEDGPGPGPGSLASAAPRKEKGLVKRVRKVGMHGDLNWGGEGGGGEWNEGAVGGPVLRDSNKRAQDTEGGSVDGRQARKREGGSVDGR